MLKIGQVSQALGLEQYVLRYWETEFKELRPARNPAGQRLYSEEDMALLRRIVHLLYERHFTIAGARAVLAGSSEAHSSATPEAPTGTEEADRALLKSVVRELKSLREELRSKG